MVPPVYCRKATSSGPIAGLLNLLPRPAATASLKATAPGIEYGGTIFFTRRTAKLTIIPFRPSMSPMLAMMTCFTAVLGITC